MRLFPFALTQSEDSEEQLPATSPVSLSQTHLPQNTFRRLPPLPLPFRPPAARGHSPGTRPPPPQGLPSHALVSPPARPLPRFLATLHSIARTGSRPSVRPSVIQKSVSLKRGVIFRAHKGSEGREDRGKEEEDRDISSAFCERRRRREVVSPLSVRFPPSTCHCRRIVWALFVACAPLPNFPKN